MFCLNLKPGVCSEVTKEGLWKRSQLNVILTGQSRNLHVRVDLPIQPYVNRGYISMTISRHVCVTGTVTTCPGDKFKWSLNVWMPHYIWVSENLSLQTGTVQKASALNREQLHWSWQDNVGKKASNSSAAYQAASPSFLLKAPSVLSPPPTRGRALCTRIHQSKQFTLNCPRSWITLATVSQKCGTLQSRGFEWDSLKTVIVPSSVQK